MARLSAARRKKLPKGDFGLPGRRGYPMPDKSHARNAKARAAQAVNAGRMSRSTEEKIDAKADRKLGKSRAKSRKKSPERSRRAREKRLENVPL